MVKAKEVTTLIKMGVKIQFLKTMGAKDSFNLNLGRLLNNIKTQGIYQKKKIGKYPVFTLTPILRSHFISSNTRERKGKITNSENIIV